jgi:hypothetical protein
MFSKYFCLYTRRYVKKRFFKNKSKVNDESIVKRRVKSNNKIYPEEFHKIIVVIK